MPAECTAITAVRRAAVVLAYAALLGQPSAAQAQQPAPTEPPQSPAAHSSPAGEPDDGRRAGVSDEAVAPEEGGAEPQDPRLRQARELFLRGASLVKKAHWSEALNAFERSAKLRSHAVTTYNIGACLRAMGHYVQARERFAAALAQDRQAAGKELSERLRSDTKAFIGQMDGLLAHLRIDLRPPSAAIAIDGRPLEVHTKGPQPTLLAGTRRAGPGEPPPQGRFDVLVDPGARVITLSREGYRDVVVNRTFGPGTTTDLELYLDKLPATLAIQADRQQAVVKVNEADVGYAPVEVSRPAGLYKVLVEKDGFVPYETKARLQPGAHLNITATLPEEEPGLYEKWWFWTAVGAVVTGTVLVTYFATKPEPERPAPDGGGLGWAIEVP